MNKQQILLIISATTGLVAAGCFVVGSIFISVDDIINVSTPYWDGNPSFAQALADQKAQYLAGALLLLASFCLQIAAALTPSTTTVRLPRPIQSWPLLAVVVLISSCAIAFVVQDAAKTLSNKKIQTILLEQSQP